MLKRPTVQRKMLGEILTMVVECAILDILMIIRSLFLEANTSRHLHNV